MASCESVATRETNSPPGSNHFVAILPRQVPGYVRLDISTITYGPPRNAIVQYGGILGAAFDEIGNQARDQATQLIQLRYDAGIYTLADANRAFAQINSSRAWQPLAWYDLLPPNKGGLPVATTFIIGPSQDFINNGLFRLDHKFGFKLKDHEISGERFGRSSGGRVDIGDPLLRNWTARFRPTASFSSKMPFINHIGLGIYLDYRRRGVKRLELGVIGRYKPDEGLEGNVSLELWWP